MQAQKTRTTRLRLMQPLIAALAAAASAGAWADDPSPYYIGASQTFTHDSNVFRTPDGPGGNYSSTGLLAGVDQKIGRQRVYATANVRYNKYQDQTTLDNTSYGVSAGWDWATIERLSGSVNVNANQNLASLGGNAVRPLNSRNVVRSEQVATSVRWGGESVLTFEGSYAHSRVRYSALESLSSEATSDSASAGVYYRVSADLKLGSAVRFTRTVSPFGVAITPVPTGPADYQPNTSNGRNLDFSADWRVSPQTGVNARLSWTRQTNSQIGGRDFSGLTGSIATNYAPTAKLAFTAAVSRDVGTGKSAFVYNVAPTGSPTPIVITSINGVSQNSQTTDALSLGATYAATAKINVTAGLQYRRGALVDSVVVAGVPTNAERSDRFRNSSLGVNYAIARNWQLGCDLAHESRSLSGTLGYSYSANIASCTAQFTLR